jgi:hypothetical protein
MTKPDNPESAASSLIADVPIYKSSLLDEISAFMLKVSTLPTRENEQRVCPKAIKEATLRGAALVPISPSLFDENETGQRVEQ